MGEWRVLPLGDVVECLDSLRRPVRSSERSSGPYPYYGASGVIDHVDGFLFDGAFTLVAEDGENLRTRSTPVSFLAQGKFWVNNHAHILSGTERSDVRFLSYVLENSDISAYLTGSTQPKLTQQSLLSMRFAWPPFPEQRAIAEVLGALDDKIVANRRLAHLLEERLKVLFARNEFDVSDNNDGRLDDFVLVNPSRPKPFSNVAPYVDMAALPVDSALVVDCAHRLPKSGTRFINGDTVMARITPCLENGKIAYIDCLEGDDIGVGSTEFIVLRPKSPVPPWFTYFLARSEPFREYAVRHMSGSSGRQRCPADVICRYPIRRPESSLVEDFGRECESAFGLMRSGVNESVMLEKLRDTLLPKLMSGELRVRDAENLVEEAV